MDPRKLLRFPDEGGPCASATCCNARLPDPLKRLNLLPMEAPVMESGTIEITKDYSACIFCGACNDPEVYEGRQNINARFFQGDTFYSSGFPDGMPTCCDKAKVLFGGNLALQYCEEPRVKVFQGQPEEMFHDAEDDILAIPFNHKPVACVACGCTHFIQLPVGVNNEDAEFFICCGCENGMGLKPGLFKTEELFG